MARWRHEQTHEPGGAPLRSAGPRVRGNDWARGHGALRCRGRRTRMTPVHRWSWPGRATRRRTASVPERSWPGCSRWPRVTRWPPSAPWPCSGPGSPDSCAWRWSGEWVPTRRSPRCWPPPGTLCSPGHPRRPGSSAGPAPGCATRSAVIAGAAPTSVRGASCPSSLSEPLTSHRATRKRAWPCSATPSKPAL